MQKIKLLLFSILISTLSSCGQTSNTEKTLKIESKTFECMTDWMTSKGVDWKELKSGFENYFSQGEITKSSDPIEKQYWDILSYFEHPSKRFPIFKDKKLVVNKANKLGLGQQEIMTKKQLDCLLKNYTDNKSQIDTTSTYFVFGDIIETINKVPNVSPGLVAGGIKYGIKQEDLKKEFYQLTIVLLYYFDMTLFLTDGKE